MLSSDELDEIAALLVQRRDNPDEFDDDWQHDDGAEFWRMMPDLLALAREAILLKTTIKDWDGKDLATLWMALDDIVGDAPDARPVSGAEGESE